ncbi:PREDICTED: opioid growth factor receptor [Miniopterus natalensis]|uniref:opioid growth factor receptor n=1 Tax=Miniopterus natalensis TaxID=291302 RepID=UPI0007A6CE99|nr:PREDICTED: opioid growth factor receptor [Miniopterus natalensis]
MGLTGVGPACWWASRREGVFHGVSPFLFSSQSRPTGSRNWRAVRDTRRYRHHYPDLIERDSNGDMPNLSFYRNEIRFLPNGCFIEDILQNWRDDYDLLEDNHSYIQWLFPLREPGVNWHAKPLTQREIEAFKSSKEARERFVQAYELMLGFYGIELEDRDTGKVRRAQSYQKRFQNLNCPKESKKRKLEENRPERAPGDAGPQSASEVEIIALNLEGCALSQGSVGAGTQEMDSQDPGETEQPGPRPPGAEVADEVRKRRKVDQALAPAGRPEAGGGENGAEGEAEGDLDVGEAPRVAMEASWPQVLPLPFPG